MGAGFSSSNATTVVNTEASLYQINKTECLSTTQNSLSGVTFVVDSSNIGSIEISQTGTANSDCIINNNLDAISDLLVSTIQENVAQGKSGLFNLGVQVSIANTATKDDIKNTITQSITNLCNSSSINTGENFNFFISNSNVDGAIKIEQNASANASCVIDNLAKIKAYTDVTAENKGRAGGGGGPLAGLIGGIIAIVIVAVVIILLLSLFGKAFGNKGDKEGDEYEGEDLTDISDKLEIDDLSSDDIKDSGLFGKNKK